MPISNWLDFRGPNGIWTLEQKAKKTERKLSKKSKNEIKKETQEEIHEDHKRKNDAADRNKERQTDAKLQTVFVKGASHCSLDSACDQTRKESIHQNASDLKSTIDPISDTFLKSFEQIQPSLTHLAIAKLVQLKLVHLVVSQNVDGLFLKTGLLREYLCEMHGNFFLDECVYCLKR